MLLDIDAAYPISFILQLLNQMTADEPAGSTYKIRGQEYFFRGKRAFPSYLQAGPSFFIEKSKRRMIAEDIAAALRLVSEDRG